MHRFTVPVLVGPTAGGKTALACSLASRFPRLEAISADSRQVYRRLNVGTAKPSPEELAALPHHLIDVIEPTDTYSAGRFRSDAERAIGDCLAGGAMPIVVGGTGFYLRSLTQGLSPMPAVDPDVHSRLTDEIASEGSAALHARLKEIDPEAAAGIEPADPQRIVRALSVWESTGRRLSDWWNERPEPSEYAFRWLGLRWERPVLRERIRIRTEAMLQAGLREEVERLLTGGLTWADNAMRTVGYREWEPFFGGEAGVREVAERITIHTAQYAKRQMTWFRSVEEIRWIEAADESAPEAAGRWLGEVLAENHLP